MGLDGKMDSLNHAIREALPSMLTVEDQNPNASILVRTLRFSGGARWMEPEMIPLSAFRWTDLVADNLPRTAEFSAEFRSRLQREGAQSGDVQVSLMWNNFNDLDLHVVCPSGETIFFGHRRSACGGELDVDMNVTPTSEQPVENIYWPSGGAPHGHYKVLVNHYHNHRKRGCQDPTPYRVAVKMGGYVQEYTGAVSHRQPPQVVCEFDLDNRSMATLGGGNTEMGTALTLLSEQLRTPPMPQRALPPVLVLISDGQPTDNYDSGLTALMNQPWGRKAVRIAIAIGQDVDLDLLRRFIDNPQIPPLQANNPEDLVRYIKWVSTDVLQTASSPATRTTGTTQIIITPPPPVIAGPASAMDVW